MLCNAGRQCGVDRQWERIVVKKKLYMQRDSEDASVRSRVALMLCRIAAAMRSALLVTRLVKGRLGGDPDICWVPPRDAPYEWSSHTCCLGPLRTAVARYGIGSAYSFVFPPSHPFWG